MGGRIGIQAIGGMRRMLQQKEQTENLIAKLKPGDVIVTSGRFEKFPQDVPSFLIRLANFMKRGWRSHIWTHVALYAGNEEIIEAMPGVKVQSRNIREAYLENPDFKAMAVRIRNAPRDAFKHAVEICRLQCGQAAYDGTALLYFVMEAILPEKD